MYDVAILGAGPAGVTAAIYFARFKLKTLLLSQNIGGWVNNAYIIENLPSKKGIGGSDLAKNYKEQVKNNEIDFRKETVTSLTKDEVFNITTKKDTYNAKFVLYALGTTKKMPNVPGEGKLLGKGVHTCATCDAPFYRDEDVVVLGGNDAGAKAALLLSEYANKIHMIEMQETIPMEPTWKEKVEALNNIEFHTGVSVKEFQGDEQLNKVVLTDDTELDAKGAFIEIGSDPNVSLLEDTGVELDKFQTVDVDEAQQTSVDGLYAAGDLTNNSNNLRQIVTAQGEGAVAAQAIYRRLM